MALAEKAAARPRRSLTTVLVVALLLQGCFYLGLQATAWSGGVIRVPAAPEDPAARQARWRAMGYHAELDPALGLRLPATSLQRIGGGYLTLSGSVGRDTLVIFLPDYG